MLWRTTKRQLNHLLTKRGEKGSERMRREKERGKWMLRAMEQQRPSCRVQTAERGGGGEGDEEEEEGRGRLRDERRSGKISTQRVTTAESAACPCGAQWSGVSSSSDGSG